MMTKPESLHNKAEIEQYLRRAPFLHLYELGDLDDFFWPYTTWAGLRTPGGALGALYLLYSGAEVPVLLAVAAAGQESLCELLKASQPLLPRRFYAHLSPGLSAALSDGYTLENHGRFLKMGLTDPARLAAVDPGPAVQFLPPDAEELRRFYDTVYPGNWFDPRMLETGCYYGFRQQGQIVSVAGIHVYSPRYRAAALGNITTHPDWRGQGLSTRVTARLCQAMQPEVDFIGLNVRASNAAALSVYTRLGFTPQAEYEEFMVTAR